MDFFKIKVNCQHANKLKWVKKIKNSVIDPLYETGRGEYRKSAIIHYLFIDETNVRKNVNYA